MIRKSLLTTFTVILMVLLIAGPAVARTALNTIDPTATLRRDGRKVVVTGPLACTQVERFELQVTVTQDATGAVAEGRTQGVCTEEVQQWAVEAVVRDGALLEEGAAQACAVATTRLNGEITDTKEWCREGGVTLVEGE